MASGRGFVLRERLGEGGFGVVFRAFEPALEREVAVKVIHPALAADPQFGEKFEAEARTVARLEHPHIVPLYSFGRDEDGAWLVMRLLRGGSLADALERGPWRPSAAARLLREVAGALEVAHRHGVVHRDIKPANILLDREGSAYLADFGIAFDAFSGAPGRDGPGSAAYMAPEQLEGEPASEATDAYSLGVVLFETLTGDLPWKDDPLPILLRRRLEESLPDLSRIRADLPAGLGEILLKVTARDPADRPSLDEFVEAFAGATVAEREAEQVFGFMPEPPGSVVGRDTEITEVLGLIGEHRVVTLTGVGGVGKSALGFTVAHRAADGYSSGAMVARLGTVIDPQRVGDAVARAIGATGRARDEAATRIQAALRTREMLVVLDGCEQVIEAVAELVEQVLQTAPDVRFIVTSRERLGITAEVVFPVPPLSVPPESVTEADRLSAFPAVRLFADRAAAVRPDFALTVRNAPVVAEICRHLDGIPLAVELAAARIRVLTPDQIKDRLEDRFSLLTGGARTALPQQRTLQGAIDWSYHLLLLSEQEMFCRLSVFLGGCTLEAAEQVCAGDGIDTTDILDLICALVDKSLLTTTEAAGQLRYGMLESINEYASRQLDEGRDGEPWRRRHADHYARFVETGRRMIAPDHSCAGTHAIATDQANWLDMLSKEHDNIRTALRYALSTRDASLAGRIGGAAWTFWKIRGHIAEGRTWLERVLEMPEPPERATLTEVLIGAAELAVDQGDMAAARGCLNRALTLAKERSSTRDAAAITAKLANLAHKEGDLEAAIALKEEALSKARSTGDDWIVGRILPDLALLYECIGDHQRAFALAHEALEMGRRSANPYLIANAALSAGDIALNRDDLETARRCFEEATTRAETVGLGDIGAWALAYLGKLALATGEIRQARRLLERSLARFRELEYPIGASWALCHLGRALLAGGEYGEAGRRLEEALELAREYVSPDIPVAVQALGVLAVEVGEDERAAALLGAAHGLRQRFGLEPAPSERRESDEAWIVLRGRLDPRRAAELADHGRSMTVDDVVSYVMRVHGARAAGPTR